MSKSLLDRPSSTDPPPAWGADSLSRYLDDAAHNTLATFANLPEQYGYLAEVDQLFSEMIDNLNQHPEFVAGFLLFRTHSSFRAAVRLCLGGQVAESYMVLRGCLESALYGLYVAGNRNRQEIWLRRHDDESSKRRVRSEFTITNVLGFLASVDATTHDIAARLYDRTIDYGAHPNERAVSTQIRTQSTSARIDFTADYLLAGDLPHLVSLKSVAQIGICCLDILEHVFRDRYRILQIDARLEQLHRQF
jgi:hypothetical protein